jgi:transposase
MEQRRKRAARMFNQGLHAAEVARRLGVGRQSTGRWKRAWEAGGSDALKSKGQAGRKPLLNTQQREEITIALIKGPEAQGYRTNLWTLPRVALLIKRMTGVDYHSGHVWYLLRSLGFSCQRPTRRAIERNEHKIAGWKQTTWLVLKKRPAKKAAPSSS